MVDLTAYLDPEDGEPEEGDDQDLAALKDCLKALADALASTNLAVITSAAGDREGAGRRVQASVKALKRFSAAFAILEGPAGETGAEPKNSDD